jgi:hypothetical protein
MIVTEDIPTNQDNRREAGPHFRPPRRGQCKLRLQDRAIGRKSVMSKQETPDRKGVRLFPPPSKDFDPFAATEEDLKRHGLPLRPDPHTQPGMAALWERQAGRYRGFDHLEPRPDTATAAKNAAPVAGLGPDPSASCGYQLFSPSAPFTALFVTWTVPDLRFSPGPFDTINHFHTFVGLGFLDVHVEMTVDSAQNVTTNIWAQSVGQVNLPVRPGDVISGTLCLDTTPPGRASYFLANETTAQTINFAVDTGFPLPSPSPRASLAVGAPHPPSSTHWPASGSSTSTKSAPTRRVAPGRSPRVTPSPWSTNKARPSPGPSGSTTSPSRPCL